MLTDISACGFDSRPALPLSCQGDSDAVNSGLAAGTQARPRFTKRNNITQIGMDIMPVWGMFMWSVRRNPSGVKKMKHDMMNGWTAEFFQEDGSLRVENVGKDLMVWLPQESVERLKNIIKQASR